MKLTGVVVMAAILITSGCAGTSASPPSVTTLPSTSVVAPSASASVTPSALVTPSAAPTVPVATGALDVSTWKVSMFASPSGKIWCAIQKDAAWCHFPSDFKGKIPSSKKICPKEQLDVTGVAVGKKVEYFCSGDPTAYPAVDSDYGLEWFAGSGYPTVKYSGLVLATLPYQEKLADGSFVCLSQTTGVTCGDMNTGLGFTMARAGVTFIS